MRKQIVKQLLSIACAVSMVASLAACGNAEPKEESKQKESKVEESK